MARSSRFVACAAVLTTFVSLTFASTAQAQPARVPRITVRKVTQDWRPARTAMQQSALENSSRLAGIKTFTRSIQDGTSTFQYTIVGKDPFVTQTAPSTSIPTVVFPLRIHFSNGDTFDPTVVNDCDSVSALNRTLQSPVFVAQKWRANAAPLGKAQYVDAVQREQWYSQTKVGAINPGYHVKLVPTTHAKITVNVPAGQWATGSDFCDGFVLGAISISWFDNYVQKTLIPSITGATKVFPLFLVENVVWYNGSPGNCCILGYHNAFTNPASQFQSYGVANYDSAFNFDGDVSTLTHEVSEWVNDPNTANPTKPWGHTGQVTGCQSNLETGDPLSGSIITDTLNGFTYHLQELAFFSWFYHQKPSLGANGWYSSGGSFTTPAAKCT